MNSLGASERYIIQHESGGETTAKNPHSTAFGLGQLTITAIYQNDYPTIYATSMLFAVLVIAGNLVADILYGVVDPRIKY